MEVGGGNDAIEGDVMSDVDMEVGMRPMIGFGWADRSKRGWESVTVALARSALHFAIRSQISRSLDRFIEIGY